MSIILDFIYFSDDSEPKRGDHRIESENSKENGGLFPSIINLASKAKITANATCGSEGEEVSIFSIYRLLL